MARLYQLIVDLFKPLDFLLSYLLDIQDDRKRFCHRLHLYRLKLPQPPHESLLCY